ncbi:MAG TPA: glycosyltransferase family 2 protein [Bdellovibrionales bacterium]|nr:glycosyltransferase family 2 protein [Bdellovibrionales bacterium]
MAGLALFIPMYNCGKQIERVLNSLEPSVRLHFSEILILDNGSSDNGPQTVRQWIATNQLVNVSFEINSENLGFGGSHKKAFSRFIDRGHDYCLVLHGDDQASIRDFLPLLRDKEFQHWDHVLGSRFSWQSRLVNYSKIRVLGNVFFNALASVLKRRLISDLGGSGLNIYSLNRLEEMNYLSFPNDLTFHTSFLLDALTKRNRYRFVPISWREYDQISNVRIYSQSLNLLRTLTKDFVKNLRSK